VIEAPTCCGLPLADPDDPEIDIGQPLEALVVIKGLSKDGRVSYWTVKTPDLHVVEAWGMAMFAVKTCEGN
jgi:hypothetical protein